MTNRRSLNGHWFERALHSLNIEGICALTPQAKGRIERLFKTLQDRLVKAMRLADINNMARQPLHFDFLRTSTNVQRSLQVIVMIEQPS